MHPPFSRQATQCLLNVFGWSATPEHQAEPSFHLREGGSADVLS